MLNDKKSALSISKTCLFNVNFLFPKISLKVDKILTFLLNSVSLQMNLSHKTSVLRQLEN